MSGSLLILLLALLVVSLVGGGYLFYKRRQRRQKISEILSDPNLLAHWTYTPDEWQKAVAEEFTWARSKDPIGEVYISSSAVYVKSGSGDRLIALSGNGKVVTNAAYRGAEGSPLKFRVRWKIVSRDQHGREEVKYFKEDYRIPVPVRLSEEARRVVDFFTARLQDNLAAYTAVVPDDEPISLFGKDTF
jgi:hypothetical protein